MPVVEFDAKAEGDMTTNYRLDTYTTEPQLNSERVPHFPAYLKTLSRFVSLEPSARFELATSWFEAKHSSSELRGHD